MADNSDWAQKHTAKIEKKLSGMSTDKLGDMFGIDLSGSSAQPQKEESAATTSSGGGSDFGKSLDFLEDEKPTKAKSPPAGSPIAGPLLGAADDIGAAIAPQGGGGGHHNLSSTSIGGSGPTGESAALGVAQSLQALAMRGLTTNKEADGRGKKFGK